MAHGIFLLYCKNEQNQYILIKSLKNQNIHTYPSMITITTKFEDYLFPSQYPLLKKHISPTILPETCQSRAIAQHLHKTTPMPAKRVSKTPQESHETSSLASPCRQYPAINSTFPLTGKGPASPLKGTTRRTILNFPSSTSHYHR